MAWCIDRLDERVKQSFLMVGSPQIGPSVQAARTLTVVREVRTQLPDGASFGMNSSTLRNFWRSKADFAGFTDADTIVLRAR